MTPKEAKELAGSMRHQFPDREQMVVKEVSGPGAYCRRPHWPDNASIFARAARSVFEQLAEGIGVEVDYLEGNRQMPFISAIRGLGKAASATLLPGFWPWLQTLVNPTLSLFVTGSYSPPEAPTGAIEIIADLAGNAQEREGMKRTLGVVSLGPVWVHAYYVQNLGGTGYDKIRFRARDHIDNLVVWTFDIAISTINNATLTSIPATSNLFWDPDDEVLHSVDFRFYAMKIPDPAAVPTELQERNVTARRGAGVAGNSILHHSGSTLNLYKYDLGTGWGALAASFNLNSPWPSGWTAYTIFTADLLNDYRHFNRPWVFAEGRWSLLLAARGNNSTANQAKSQVRLFTVDPVAANSANGIVQTIDGGTIEIIDMTEVTAAYDAFASGLYPYPASPSPSAMQPTQSIYLGAVTGEVTYLTGWTIQQLFMGAIQGHTVTQTVTTPAEGDPFGIGTTTNVTAGTSTANYSFIPSFNAVALCPRPNHALSLSANPGHGLSLVDFPAPVYHPSQPNSVYPGLSAHPSGDVVCAWIEPVALKWAPGNNTTGAINQSSATHATSVVPNVGWEPGDPGWAVQVYGKNIEKHFAWAKTMLVYLDPVSKTVSTRVELSDRGLFAAPFVSLNSVVVNNTTPVPLAGNAWQLAVVMGGMHEGAVVALLDKYDFANHTRDPQLSFKIVGASRTVVYASAALGPPQAVVAGHSNAFYNGRNAYQYSAFRTGVSTVRIPQVGTPQVRILAPDDGSAPFLVIGLWSERITDGDNPAAYDNDHFRADIWIYRLTNLAAPTLLRHLTEAKKTTGELTLPKCEDFGRMLLSNGVLKYITFLNNQWRLMAL